MKQTAYLFLFIACMFSSTLIGQTNFGVRFQTGIQQQHSESMYLLSSGKSVDYDLSLSTVANSNSIGLFTQFNFGFIYFQPEILYTTFSSNYEIENFMSESASEIVLVHEKTNRIDLPINAGITFKNFRFGGGPIFQFAQDTDSGLSDFKRIAINHKKIAAGFQGGIAYQWKFIQFDVKYQRDFNSATDHISHLDNPIKSKSSNSSLQLGIALMISK